MLLHNSASVLNPAGHYLFLRGAAYPPIAYYIETSRIQGEALQGGKATSMHTQMHAGDEHFHTWMDKGQSCLSKKISDLPIKMNWTGETVFPSVIIFFAVHRYFLGVFVLLQDLCFPPQLISRHKVNSPMSPPLLKSAWIGGSHLRWKSTQVSPSNMGRTLWRTARGTLVATRFSLKTLQKSTS